MITPLDIENKKFSKRAFNGYSTEEVDDFLDELTLDYEKIYKEVNESRKTIESLNNDVVKYRQMETTLQNTLLMAQSAAEEIKNGAKQEAENIKTEAMRQVEDARNDAKRQADMLISNAENSAQSEIARINSEIMQKQRELEEMQRQCDSFRTQMESLLVSQMELLKNPLRGMQ